MKQAFDEQAQRHVMSASTKQTDVSPSNNNAAEEIPIDSAADDEEEVK